MDRVSKRVVAGAGEFLLFMICPGACKQNLIDALFTKGSSAQHITNAQAAPWVLFFKKKVIKSDRAREPGACRLPSVSRSRSLCLFHNANL